jgi:hypothetical protein
VVPGHRAAGRPVPVRPVLGGPALYHRLPDDRRAGAVRWPGKAGVTFSDALTAGHRWLWADAVFPQAAGPAAVQKLPPPLRDLVLSGLATAA